MHFCLFILPTSGRAQVATAVDQAIDGDFRASAASTVKAVGVGVATGVALGELVLLPHLLKRCAVAREPHRLS